MTVSNSCFFPSCFVFNRLSLGFFYKTLNYFCPLLSPSSLYSFESRREAHYYGERERERERDGWCVYSSQQRWQNDSDDEHFYDDQEKGEQEEELARRRLGGAKKEIESKENG